MYTMLQEQYTSLGSLLQKSIQTEFKKSISAEYTEIRNHYLTSNQTEKTTYTQRSKKKSNIKLIGMTQIAITQNDLGIHRMEWDVKTLLPFIDWTPFFHSWNVSGTYPKLLEDSLVGTEAQKLFQDAMSHLNLLAADPHWKAQAIFGLIQSTFLTQ
jgi:5-methyltetrahydrofolate--homocysteine methyltransferase